MTQKHTPGPWVKDSDGQLRGSNNNYVSIYNAGLVGVYKCEEADANVALIAAAPDLLEALKELLEREWQDDEGSDTLEAARRKSEEAIAKAEGTQS